MEQMESYFNTRVETPSLIKELILEKVDLSGSGPIFPDILEKVLKFQIDRLITRYALSNVSYVISVESPLGPGLEYYPGNQVCIFVNLSERREDGITYKTVIEKSAVKCCWYEVGKERPDLKETKDENLLGTLF